MAIRKHIDAGETFGRLTVIGLAPPKTDTRGAPIYRLRCLCTCGRETVVYETKLRYGSTRSCGCLRNKNRRPRITHGLTRSPTYVSWQAMRQRCTRPSINGYENYGGRGITVCERWNKFQNFLIDMGLRPEGTTLDRIDPNGHYEPTNCRWSTWHEQERNRRNCVTVTIDGRPMTLSDARTALNISPTTLRYYKKRFGTHQAAVDALLQRPKKAQRA